MAFTFTCSGLQVVVITSPPPPPPPSGADFAAGSDFSTGFVNIYDATTLLFGTDDGSSITGITSAYFGQAATTLPNFTGNQIQLKFSGSGSITSSPGNTSTTDLFTLNDPVFNPTKNYVCSFYLSNGFNYRIVFTPSALYPATTLTNQGRIEFRFGNVAGLAYTLFAGGVTSYIDGGINGNQASATIAPSMTPTTSELLLLEKIAIVP